MVTEVRIYTLDVSEMVENNFSVILTTEGMQLKQSFRCSRNSCVYGIPTFSVFTRARHLVISNL